MTQDVLGEADLEFAWGDVRPMIYGAQGAVPLGTGSTAKARKLVN